MSRKTEEDYSTVIKTSNVEERNDLIEKLYHEGREYFYTDKKNDGTYIVAYN